MRYFRELTSTSINPHVPNAVIMGRKTWESIPAKMRPLPNRLNVILTRQGDYDVPEGVVKVASLGAALEFLCTLDIDRVFVLGGGEVYAESMLHKDCDAIYLTEIKAGFDCDTFFPDYSTQFCQVSQSEYFEENGLKYCFKVLRNIAHT
jgi:dihydrofolate reductase / thymidylate synthase